MDEEDTGIVIADNDVSVSNNKRIVGMQFCPGVVTMDDMAPSDTCKSAPPLNSR